MSTYMSRYIHIYIHTCRRSKRCGIYLSDRSSVEGPLKPFQTINLETAKHLKVDMKCNSTTSV